MRWFRTDQPDPLPHKFDKLARYNTEVARGVVHTVTWVEQMVGLQAEFNLWSREQYGSPEDTE